MVQAAAAGRLNFKEADSNDIRWMLRERLVLDAVDREYAARLTAAKHLQHSAAASCWPLGDMEGKLYRSHGDEADTFFDGMSRLLMPWWRPDEKTALRDEADGMRREFTRVFGDPSSPEIKRKARMMEDEAHRRELEGKRQSTIQENLLRDRTRRLSEYRVRRNRRIGARR
jgi:hypothetical protein